MDSPEQMATCRTMFPNMKTTLFIKPAPDNMFKPEGGMLGIHKDFDVCFPANGTQSFKGHDFVYKTVPEDLKLLSLGFPSKRPYPSNVIQRRVKRSTMPSEIQRCKVGIVCCEPTPDSCPRVIPEMLACGIPIVVLKGVRFWKDKYLTPETGRMASKERFWDVVREVLANPGHFKPRRYYKDHLRLHKAAEHIRARIL